MHALALPLALFFALLFFGLFPGAKPLLEQQLSRLYAAFLRPFTRKNGRADQHVALPLFVLLCTGIAQLVGAIHPVASALVTALTLQGFAEIPCALRAQEALNRGDYAHDIPAYEALVRTTCISLTRRLAAQALLPLLLAALSMPFHLSSAFVVACCVLQMLPDQLPQRAADVRSALEALADRLMQALLLLCACVVGKSPFHTRGSDAASRLLSILDIAEDAGHARAPVSGDIAQALLLCGLCLFIAVLIATPALLAVL